MSCVEAPRILPLAEIPERRPLPPPSLHGPETAIPERAAFRNPGKIRDRSRNIVKNFAIAFEKLGNRTEQSDGVGMFGPLEQALDRSLFYDQSRVHHRDVVADLGHNAQVVGYEI